MRDSIDAPTLALYNSGEFDLHTKVLVENADDTAINLSDRCKGVQLRLPDPNEPIGSSTITFVRENTTDGDSTSLSPTIVASSYNEDDVGAYAALLQLGRIHTIEVALTAYGGARPGDGSSLWYEIFSGPIAAVEWPKYDNGTITIKCHGLAGIFQLTKSETAYTYTASTSIETVAQQILTNHGFTGITLTFTTATGKVLPNDWAPGLQDTVWSQLWSLALSMGWLCYFQYTGTGGPELTFFEPARTKTVPDYTVDHWWDFEALSIDEEEVRNVGYVQYFDTSGVATLLGPDINSASIAKYGGAYALRRTFWIALTEDSPVRSGTAAQELLDAALSDVSDPDAIATVRTYPLVFAESGVDLYTFQDIGRFFDSNQDLAPFGTTIVIESGIRAHCKIQVRGVPTAGYQSWKTYPDDKSTIAFKTAVLTWVPAVTLLYPGPVTMPTFALWLDYQIEPGGVGSFDYSLESASFGPQTGSRDITEDGRTKLHTIEKLLGSIPGSESATVTITPFKLAGGAVTTDNPVGKVITIEIEGWLDTGSTGGRIESEYDPGTIDDSDYLVVGDGVTYDETAEGRPRIKFHYSRGTGGPPALADGEFYFQTLT